MLFRGQEEGSSQRPEAAPVWGGRGTGWGRQKLGTTGRRAFERDTQVRLRGGGDRPIETETLVCGGQRCELLKQRAMRNSHRLTLLRGFRRRRIVRRRRVRIALPSGLWSRTLEANEAIPQACGRPHPAQHPAPSSRAARPSVEGPAQVISRAPFLRKPLENLRSSLAEGDGLARMGRPSRAGRRGQTPGKPLQGPHDVFQ